MSAPSPSKALGNVTPASAANESACGIPSLLITPTTRTLLPAAPANCWSTGISSRQGGHQLPQRLTTVGTPGAFPRSSDPPPGQSKDSAGSSSAPAAFLSGCSGHAVRWGTDVVGAVACGGSSSPPAAAVQ